MLTPSGLACFQNILFLINKRQLSSLREFSKKSNNKNILSRTTEVRTRVLSKHDSPREPSRSAIEKILTKNQKNRFQKFCLFKFLMFIWLTFLELFLELGIDVMGKTGSCRRNFGGPMRALSSWERFTRNLTTVAQFPQFSSDN